MGLGLKYIQSRVAEHKQQEVKDYNTQPCKLFQLMSPEQLQALFDNMVGAMGDAPERDQAAPYRQLHKRQPLPMVRVWQKCLVLQ